MAGDVEEARGRTHNLGDSKSFGQAVLLIPTHFNLKKTDGTLFGWPLGRDTFSHGQR